MGKISIDYKVVITGFAVPAYMTSSGLGWDLTIDNGVGTFTWLGSGGFLLEKWSNGFSKSIDVRRGGRFSSTAGGEIYVPNFSGSGDRESSLSGYLERHNLKLEGAKITIFYGEENELQPVFTGVVTGAEPDINKLTLKYDDPSAYRNAVISRLTSDGSAYYPALFGEHDKAKLVLVEDTAENAFGEDNIVLELAHALSYIGETGGVSVLTFSASILDSWFSAKVRAFIANLEEDESAAYYAYCVDGNGKGLAYKIKRAVWRFGLITAFYLDITLEEELYTTIGPDGDRLMSVFRPAVEKVGGVQADGSFVNESEYVPVNEYDQISVFKIVKVTKRYAFDAGMTEADGAHEDELEIYVRGENGYHPVTNSGFVISSLAGKRSISLQPRDFKDDLEGVTVYAQLKGVDFKFGSGYISHNYDTEVFPRPGVPTSPPWPQGDGWRKWPNNPIGPAQLFVHNYDDLYVNGGNNDGTLDLVSVVKTSDDLAIFDNTHSPKYVLSLHRFARHDYVVNPKAHVIALAGIPFTFEFERPEGLSEVMLNYDISVETYVWSELPTAVGTSGMLLRDPNKQFYELRTSLEGAALPSPDVAYTPRHFPVDLIMSESQRKYGGRTYAMALHIINTCYDLKNFREGIETEYPDLTPIGLVSELVKRNGNFWRQDLFTADEFVTQQLTNGRTNYLMGYEAIRNGGDGGGGFFAVPEKIKGNLKFTALLAISGGSPEHNNVLDTINHTIVFNAIQCLAKIDVNTADGFYVTAKGRGPFDEDLGGDAAGIEWARVYENIVSRSLKTRF
jgi:hypothetical protein